MLLSLHLLLGLIPFTQVFPLESQSRLFNSKSRILNTLDRVVTRYYADHGCDVEGKKTARNAGQSRLNSEPQIMPVVVRHRRVTPRWWRVVTASKSLTMISWRAAGEWVEGSRSRIKVMRAYSRRIGRVYAPSSSLLCCTAFGIIGD